MPSPDRSIREDELLAQMGWVRDLARALVRDPARAEDLAQEAWLTATLRPPRSYEGEGGLRAWLATVVRNLVRKDVRTNTRRARRELQKARPEGQEDVADVVERGALHSQLSVHVMGLEEPMRSAVLLRYLDELPATEVARRQGISHAAARKRISRGLAQLRARLDGDYGGDREAWCLAFLPLAQLRPAAGVAASTSTAAAVGGLFMNYKLVLVAGAVALIFTLALVSGPGRGLFGDPDPDALPTEPDRPAVGRVDGVTVPVGGERRSEAVRVRRLEVVDPRGEPRADLLALLLADGELLAAARTDRLGRIEIRSELAPEEVLLCRSNLRPMRAPLDATAPDQRVVVRGGARVGGHASLGGAQGPAELWLTSDRADPVLEGLSSTVLEALEEEGVTDVRLSVSLDGDGPFHFDGLGLEWTGALELPGAFYIAGDPSEGALDEDGALLLLEPTSTLSLELDRLQSLRGRAVEAGSGRGLAGVEVVAWQTLDFGLERLGSGIQTDERGYFELALRGVRYGERSWRIDLELATPGARTATFSLAPDDLVTADDLGELPLEFGRTLVVDVRAEDGAAVAGATVRTLGGEEGAFGQTDGAGRTELLGVFPEMEKVGVYAPGYALAEVPVPAAGQLRVELTASNHLEVRVLDQDGQPLDRLKVRVECEEMPFTSELADRRPARRRRFRQAFELDSDARLSLGELRPGLLLTLAAVDDLGGELVQREVYTPGHEAHDVVELVVRVRAFQLEGIVSDATGRPLPRAQVHAEAEDHVYGARTDADGRFAIGPLYAPIEVSHMEFSHPGFMTEGRNDVSVGPGSTPLEVVLDRGSPLEVECMDGNGHPIHASWLLATFEGRSVRIGSRTEVAGRYQFEAVPQVAGEVILNLGGVDYTRPLAAGQAILRIVVESVGTLEVALDPAIEAQDAEFINLVYQPLDREGPEVRQRFLPKLDGFAPVVRSVPAGRYRLQVERRSFGRGRGEVELLGEPRELSVEAGARPVVILP